ncbi:MAG: phage holin family protein [bacterium]|nr:phage holin family protein [bacterium]
MLRRLIITFIANAIALLAAGYFLPGFNIAGSVLDFALVIAILTLINLIVRPIIRLVLSPLILLTLGLFNIVINGFILYIIDIYFDTISIDGLVTLLYATIILTILNTLLGANRLFKK